MKQSEKTPQPKAAIRPKTFFYRNQIRYSGGKKGILQCEGKPELDVSSPPEFGGEGSVWSPEDFFVGAVNSCTMLTFLALARKRSLTIADYQCEAEGRLAFQDGGYRFTQLILKPQVVITEPGELEQAQNLLQEAHHKCLIVNSIASDVELQGDVRVQP